MSGMIERRLDLWSQMEHARLRMTWDDQTEAWPTDGETGDLNEIGIWSAYDRN